MLNSNGNSFFFQIEELIEFDCPILRVVRCQQDVQLKTTQKVYRFQRNRDGASLICDWEQGPVTGTIRSRNFTSIKNFTRSWALPFFVPRFCCCCCCCFCFVVFSSPSLLHSNPTAVGYFSLRSIYFVIVIILMINNYGSDRRPRPDDRSYQRAPKWNEWE